MFTIQQRFHHRNGVLTVAVPDYLKKTARGLLRFAMAEAECRVHVTILLYPDPVVTKVIWRVERRGKVQKGTRFVILRSSDFAVYNQRTGPLRNAVPPFVAGPERWQKALEYSVGEILHAANHWAHAPKAHRVPIRLPDVEGIDYGLV